MTDIVLVDSSKRQVTLLIGAANNPTDKVFVVLLCRKGIHISEAIQLKDSDVDFTKGTLYI
jgi:integrase